MLLRSTAAKSNPAPASSTTATDKPKVSTIRVTADAEMSQAAIIEVLSTRAIKEVGADVAANMELQVNVNGTWEPVGMSTSGASIRFATKGHKQS